MRTDFLVGTAIGDSVATSTLERTKVIAYNGAELAIIDRERMESVAL
jgi:hypothetical protein